MRGVIVVRLQQYHSLVIIKIGQSDDGVVRAVIVHHHSKEVPDTCHVQGLYFLRLQRGVAALKGIAVVILDGA